VSSCLRPIFLKYNFGLFYVDGWRSALRAAHFVMNVIFTSSHCLKSWNFATIGLGPVIFGLPSICVMSRVRFVSISILSAIILVHRLHHSIFQTRETTSYHGCFSKRSVCRHSSQVAHTIFFKINTYLMG